MPPMHKQNITNKWAQMSVFCFLFLESMAVTVEKGTITTRVT